MAAARDVVSRRIAEIPNSANAEAIAQPMRAPLAEVTWAGNMLILVARDNVRSVATLIAGASLTDPSR